MKNLFLVTVLLSCSFLLGGGHIEEGVSMKFNSKIENQWVNCCADSAVDETQGIEYIVIVCDNGEQSDVGFISNCLIAQQELKEWIEEEYN